MAEKTEIAVIGAGPAGMAAAIYLHRAGFDPLVLEKKVPGGLLQNANLVENYPGFPGGIKGPDLADLFVNQMSSVGVRTAHERVDRVEKKGGAFNIETDSANYIAKAAIIASGTRPKEIHLSGEKSITESRVFYEIADTPLANACGKKIVVIGGGDAAFDYALNLQTRGNSVVVISRKEPHCLPLLKARAETSGINTIAGIKADSVAKSPKEMVLKCKRGKDQLEFSVDYVLAACGRLPNTEFLTGSLRKSVLRSTSIPETRVHGLFVAGDVVRGRHRQTGIAVGDGIRSAMLAEDYLKTEVRK
jgi:thioredoxin reductase (NADPH)